MFLKLQFFKPRIQKYNHSFSDFPCFLAAIISSSRLQTVSIQCLGKGQGCKSHLQSSGNSLEGVNQAGGVAASALWPMEAKLRNSGHRTLSSSVRRAGPMSPEKNSAGK